MTDKNITQSKLQFYNTLGRKVMPFVPIEGNNVKMYTCGPTVYNYAHIGNLRTYVFEDILKRTLKYFGYNVNHVMNVTDVGHLVSDADDGDDKMELAAKRENKDAYQISQFYYEAFRKDLKDLNIIEPDIWCKATDHIKEQIELVKGLEKKGVTYTIEDGVYFDTSKIDDYGKLSNLDLENLKEGARIGVVENKRNKTDFSLWKFSPKDKQRLMEWDSPWGVGFPGWHIECSAMAMRYLGNEIDIHCGGIDHVTVHHTNEIAQTETVTGKQWVNYWMHGEFLVMNNGKMSKSKNNFLTLSSIKERGLLPEAYRYFLLNAHYRNQVTFSWDAIESSQVAINKIYAKLAQFKNEVKDSTNVSDTYIEKFKQDVSNDLNFPKAIAIIWEVLKDKELTNEVKYNTLLELDKMLGLGFDKVEAESEKETIVDDNINELVNQRNKARADKDYALADKLRDEISALGYTLKDTAEGTVVTKN